MVRIIAGTLMDIGMGRIPENAFQRALDTGDRLALGITAPASGLELTQVFYQQPAIGQSLFGMVE
jgi:tRNA pseudouridine38-40 synthase